MTVETFIAKSSEALGDVKLRKALAKAQTGFVSKRTAAIAECDDFPALRKQARAARDYSLDHLPDLLEQFEAKVNAAGGIVHWAETPEQLREIVLRICKEQNARYITKGKSMVSEEVHLNQALEDSGYTVDETDLGEYIIQLAGETPSHIVAPAVHKTREDIQTLFRDNHPLGDRSLEEVEQIVNEAREVIRERFIRADVGITGANMLIAETGQAVLVTNEGNGDLTASLPKCHIVTASIEKVVANTDHASAILRVLGRSATGQPITAYTSFFAGKKHAEDKDGPKQFHVVLLDNGRSEMLHNEFRPMLRCIKCAACMNHCPVYQNVGGHAYSAVYPGPMGSVLTPLLRGLPQDYQLPNASSVCGRCDEVCPVEIPLTDLMRELRNKEEAIGALAKLIVKLYTRLACHPYLYRWLTSTGVRVLRLLAGSKPSLKSFPLAGNWTKHKNIPKAPAGSFQSQWARREKSR